MGQTPFERVIEEFRAGHAEGNPDECWIWSGQYIAIRAGKMLPIIIIDRKMHGPSRIAWTLQHGLPNMGMVIAHSCDTPQCVNWHHLRQDTQSGNVKECVAKGRNRPSRKGNPGHRLTRDEVLAIYEDPRKCSLIALDYGVGSQSIWLIKTGRRHRELFDPRKVVNMPGWAHSYDKVQGISR